ncbi:hypothetical protein GCM10010430_43400 [Kitasatospora cystarginea]|uniref:Uncharacterized protein n=1 Tax=Kitasatospora cystarginea TaxID=58350 RepID=A0ABN3ECM5_9ACTN
MIGSAAPRVRSTDRLRGPRAPRGGAGRQGGVRPEAACGIIGCAAPHRPVPDGAPARTDRTDHTDRTDEKEWLTR